MAVTTFSFTTVDTTTRLLLAGPTVQFPDGTVLTEDTKDDFTFPVQGWEWHPSDEAAYEAMAPEMLPVLAQQVADQQATIDALLDAQAGVDPAVMAQLVTLGATLVGSADQLQSALTAVSGSNTAKAPLQIVNAAVQAAADT